MNMTEQAASIYEEMTGMAEAHAAALSLEEEDVDLFISNASPYKLLSITLHMQLRLIDLSLQYDSVNLEEAKNLAGRLSLDLACAIQYIKGAK